MVVPLTIVEILERSDGGITRPFLCRCEDDQLYFVKGRSAGTRSLLCEWMAGSLARAMGLPVPDFAIVQAPGELLKLHPEGRDLGPGPAFGSVSIQHVQELAISHIEDVPAQLRRDVLVFDWWVRNQDRALTIISGNPNLLWDASKRALVVIDHNLAFDQDFDAAKFSQGHVFRREIPQVFDDLAERGRYAQLLGDSLRAWEQACHSAPDDWWYADEERSVPTDFDAAAVLDSLKRCMNEDFWRLAP